MDVKDKDAFRDAGAKREARGKLVAYHQFLQAYPKSDLCDDALLEILKTQLQERDIDAAKETLAVLNHLHPAGVMERYLYVGDAEESVVLAWKTFVATNPIRSVDWGRLLVASFLAEHGKMQEARTMVVDLLASTQKPTVPNDINPRGLATEDIRSDVLKLCWSLGKKLRDEVLVKAAEKAALEEYGAKEMELASPMRLLGMRVIQKKPITPGPLDSSRVIPRN